MDVYGELSESVPRELAACVVRPDPALVLAKVRTQPGREKLFLDRFEKDIRTIIETCGFKFGAKLELVAKPEHLNLVVAQLKRGGTWYAPLDLADYFKLSQ